VWDPGHALPFPAEIVQWRSTVLRHQGLLWLAARKVNRREAKHVYAVLPFLPISIAQNFLPSQHHRRFHSCGSSQLNTRFYQDIDFSFSVAPGFWFIRNEVIIPIPGFGLSRHLAITTQQSSCE
jgi:hypothetical protein